MHCPLCGSSMREIEYEDVHVHTCDDCGGELISPEELGHIVRIRHARFPDALCASLESREPLFGPTDDAYGGRSLSCPACSKAMRVINYGGDSGICVDRCEECSVMFLDHEELEKVQILTEQWEDRASDQIRDIARQLEQARREAAETSCKAFAGSRFAFVNALVNRLLDAA